MMREEPDQTGGHGERRLRLAWFGAVVFVAVFGIGSLGVWIGESIRGPSWWAQDLVTYDAARRLVDGAALYADPKYLYTPVTTLMGVPFLIFDRFSASLVVAILKLLLAAACVLWLTRGWHPAPRVMAYVAIVTCLPFLHDLMLGNTNAFLVASMVPAVFGRSRPRNGVLLGVAAAALAKPLIIPLLLWLVIWRRQTFIGAVLGAATATAVGLTVFGLGSYETWFAAVRSGSAWLSTPFAGNHGITALWPPAWAPIAALTTVSLLFVLVRRPAGVSLVWALASGILLAPYAGTYSALPIALGMPAVGALSTWFAVGIVAASPIATTIPLPLYAAVIMLGSLVLARRAKVPSPLPLSSPAPPA